MNRVSFFCFMARVKILDDANNPEAHTPAKAADFRWREAAVVCATA